MITTDNIREKFPQSKYQEDPIWLNHVGRPISFYITTFFVNAKWSANQVSFLVMGVLMASLLSFSLSNYLISILGAILLNIYILLDCVDGNIARITKTQGRYGGLLEAVNGYLIGGTSYLAIGWAAAHSSTSLPFTNFSVHYGLLGGLTCICNLLIRAINLKVQSVFPPIDTNKTNKGQMSIAMRVDKEIGVGGLFHPLVFICALINRLHWFVIIYFIYYFLAAVYFIIDRLVKYRKFEK